MKRTGFDTMSPYRYPIYITKHPQDGFQELKANKKGSLTVAAIIILLWVFVELLYRTATDFDINPFYNTDVSLFKVSLITVLMYVIACVANWCFCTLLEGKGKMKDIFVAVAYSLVPYIIVRFSWVLLSGVFSAEEQILLDYCVILSKVWCAIICFIGLREIHEYTIGKTLFSLILTIVGILIMFFLGIIFLSVMQQLVEFVITVIFELRY